MATYRAPGLRSRLALLVAIGLSGCVTGPSPDRFTPLLGESSFTLCVDGSRAGEAHVRLERLSTMFVVREDVILWGSGQRPRETRMAAELHFAPTAPFLLRASSSSVLDDSGEDWTRCLRRSSEPLRCDIGRDEERRLVQVAAARFGLANYGSLRLWVRGAPPVGEVLIRPLFDAYGPALERERIEIAEWQLREETEEPAVLLLDGHIVPSAAQTRYALDEEGRVLAMQSGSIEYRRGDTACSGPGWW